MSYIVNLFAYQREIVNSLKEDDSTYKHLEQGRYSELQTQKFPDLTLHYRIQKTAGGFKVIFKNYDKSVKPHNPIKNGDTIFLFDKKLSKTIKVDVHDFMRIFKKELTRHISEEESIDFNLSNEQKELLCTGHDIRLNVYSKSKGKGVLPNIKSKSRVFSTDMTFFKGKTEFLIADCHDKKILQHKLTRHRENHY